MYKLVQTNTTIWYFVNLYLISIVALGRFGAESYTAMRKNHFLSGHFHPYRATSPIVSADFGVPIETLIATADTYRQEFARYKYTEPFKKIESSLLTHISFSLTGFSKILSKRTLRGVN